MTRSLQEIARQAALDADKRVDGTTLKKVADAVTVAVLQEVKREVATLLANTTTMATGWSLNDARWRSVFSELRLRVEALDALLALPAVPQGEQVLDKTELQSRSDQSGSSIADLRGDPSGV